MYRGKVTNQNEHLQGLSKVSELKNSRLQPQSETIQREIQIYTRKLQEEKKRLFRVQENHKETMQEYKIKINELQKMKSKKSKVEYSVLCSKLKLLENSLQKGISAYNQAISKNNQLKIQIDELRKQRKNQLQTFQSLQQQIEDLNSSMVQIDKDTGLKKDRVDHYKNQILAIKYQNQKHQQKCQNQITKMTSSVKFDRSMHQTLKNSTKKNAQTSDTQPIMKLRLKNLIHSNKQKMKIIDNYRKSMEKIQKSFQEIKEQSGINDLQEITSIFLKQQQQNIFILEFANKLATQLESIRQHNQQLRGKVMKKERNNDEKRLELSGTPQEKKRQEQVRRFIQQKNIPIKKTNQFLEKIQNQLLNAIGVESEILTTFNVEDYLAKFQDIINNKIQNIEFNNTPEDHIVKEQITKYSRAVPTFPIQQLKDRSEQSLLNQDKMREYATQFWDKKKNIRA